MSTPAGWYDDGQGAQRWWDGTQWSDHVQPAASPFATASAASDPAGLDTAPGGSPSDAAAFPQDAAAYPQGDAQPVPHAAAGYPGGEVPAAPYAATGHAPTAQATAPYAAPGYPQTEPPKKKSKLWILWVVLGGVVLILGILAAIIVPMIIGLIAGVGGAAGDAQRGAVSAIELYDDAWNNVDCDAYQSSTTEAYRENIGLTDCAAFEEQATAFAQSSDDYEIEVTSVSTEVDNGAASAVVTTSETYESLVDAQGAPLDEPESAEDRYTYTLIQQDGVWLIDQLE